MTEVKATAEADAPADLNEAVMGFVQELKTFRKNVNNRLQVQENRMTMFDRKTALRGRSPLASSAEAEAPHQKAFNAYVRSGDEDGLRGLTLEEKAISVADGGFLMPTVVAENVQSALRSATSIRALANVVQIDASSYDVLVETGDTGTAWTNDIAATAESANAGLARISIPLNELSAMPKASQRLLDDAAFDVEAWLSERIAERFGRAEAAAFMTGNGTDKPKGLLTQATATLYTEDPLKIGVTATTTPGDFDVADPMGKLIEVIYALGAGYRAHASFVMNSKVAARLRRQKDADGRFLWQDSVSAGEPSRLLGYPVVVSEDMPDPVGGGVALLFGDFRAGYTIVERPELRILRDPFSAKPHVLFYATKRVGGAVTDARAIKRLNFA
ncbi:phage major capsid protein [Paracoccus suum]|uniref:Phage major capsid protein n=1 Tax=Paracoccus suum TaxID=2259340 RepID=A0A344PL93_9RHOB|nr:phage major capsid protein [Paracoccus suum]AXC50148.1 phage major capsid protein [Paracoccus suum]